MKSITELLRDADPLLRESVTSSEQRDYRRKAVLAAASRARDRAGAEPRSRLTLFATLGFVMIVVLFLAERMWSPLVSNVYAAPVRFEVKLAEENPAAGLREAKVSGTDRSVYLHAEDVVTNSDISRAYIIQVDHSSQCNVGVEFNPSGIEKIRAATAGHIGKPVAILLDGQVVTTAVVREPITESAVISGLSRAEAEKIVKGITTIR
ncbi:MAG: SecDF P1 head subdomain-containing protein [Candidatus Sulfotelmatobacter sp.]